MTEGSEPNDMSKSESYKDDPEGKQKGGNLNGNPNIEDDTKSVKMNGSTADGSELNDIPKAERFKSDRIEVSKSGHEDKQKGENLDGNPNIEDETKSVKMNGRTGDGSEPNDLPKAESYKDDKTEVSKSGPDGKQKGGNLDGNPSIEDETKNVKLSGRTADGSQPNDVPKAESYKGDKMEVSKSGPEGEQNGGNLNRNPDIEDGTKNVKINRSPSGVANDAVMSNVSPICFNSKFHFYVIFIIY